MQKLWFFIVPPFSYFDFAQHGGASASPNGADEPPLLLSARGRFVGRQDQQGEQIQSALVRDGQLPLAGAPE